MAAGARHADGVSVVGTLSVMENGEDFAAGALARIDATSLLDAMDADSLMMAAGFRWRFDACLELSEVAREWAGATPGGTMPGKAQASVAKALRGGGVRLALRVDPVEAARWLVDHRYAVAVGAAVCGGYNAEKGPGVVDPAFIALALGLRRPVRAQALDQAVLRCVGTDVVAVRSAWSSIVGGDDGRRVLALTELVFGSSGPRSVLITVQRAARYVAAGVSVSEARAFEAGGGVGDERLAALAGLVGQR